MMMHILKAFLILGLVAASTAGSEEREPEIRKYGIIPPPRPPPPPPRHNDLDVILELVKKNSGEINDSNMLLRLIDSTSDQVKKQLEKQREALNVIAKVEELLAKATVFLDAQSVVLIKAINNISQDVDKNTKLTIKELNSLERVQKETQGIVLALGQKMDVYQKHVITSAVAIDKSILDLTKMVTRTVLPKLNGLECALDSLETSQVNIEVELKSLRDVKVLTQDSNAKLNKLEHQVSHLNRTQKIRLDRLIGGLKNIKPLNTWKIEGALRDLIISQKRIELDLEACSKRPSPFPHGPGPVVWPQPPRPHRPDGGCSEQQPLPYPHPIPPYTHVPRPLPGPPQQIDYLHVYDIKEADLKKYRESLAESSTPAPPPTSASYTTQTTPKPSTWEGIVPYQPITNPKQYVPEPRSRRPSPPNRRPHLPIEPKEEIIYELKPPKLPCPKDKTQDGIVSKDVMADASVGIWYDSE